MRAYPLLHPLITDVLGLAVCRQCARLSAAEYGFEPVPRALIAHIGLLGKLRYLRSIDIILCKRKGRCPADTRQDVIAETLT